MTEMVRRSEPGAECDLTLDIARWISHSWKAGYSGDVYRRYASTSASSSGRDPEGSLAMLSKSVPSLVATFSESSRVNGVVSLGVPFLVLCLQLIG